MNSISIIVVYRNREIQRIINFLESLNNQHFKKFELIFLDYGSDKSTSLSVQDAIKPYSFVHYIYHDSRGQEWNCSKAINLALQFAIYDYVFISDIDLVFHPEYIGQLAEISNENIQLYSRVYMTTQHQNDYSWNVLMQKKSFELSHTSGKGILCVNKHILLSIGGYDEYYSDWGVEDNDIFIRLSLIGLREEWVNYKTFPIFHQWHPSQNTFEKYPDKWHDDISFYYITHQNNAIRNNPIPTIIPINSRPLLHVMNTDIPEIIVEKTGYLTTKTFYYRNVWNFLIDTNIEFFKIIVPKFKVPKLSVIQTFVFQLVSFILKTIHSPFSLQYFQKIERHRYFLPERDLQWYIRKLIKETNTIKDYYIEEDEEKTIYYIQSNQVAE